MTRPATDALPTDAATIPGRPPGSPSYDAELGATAWVIVVSALIAGMGIGVMLRLAMLALRLGSPGSDGVISDDGFEIGRFTAFGVYNVQMFGVTLALAGVAAYVAVRPFLIGPRWAQVLTVATTAMLLGGGSTIHPDGVDFTRLDPTLGVVLFLVVPFLSGLLVPPVVDAVARRYGRWPIWLPAGLLVFPLTLIVAAVVLAVVALLLPVRRRLLAPILASAPLTWLLRVAFALIPVMALVDVWQDIESVL